MSSKSSITNESFQNWSSSGRTHYLESHFYRSIEKRLPNTVRLLLPGGMFMSMVLVNEDQYGIVDLKEYSRVVGV